MYSRGQRLRGRRGWPRNPASRTWRFSLPAGRPVCKIAACFRASSGRRARPVDPTTRSRSRSGRDTSSVWPAGIAGPSSRRRLPPPRPDNSP